MPYKSEKVRISGTKYDLRRKLSDEQKRAISILSSQGFSQRELARMFGCSKRTVQNLLHPAKRSVQPKRDSRYWTEAKRRYRSRKEELFRSGALSTKTNL